MKTSFALLVLPLFTTPSFARSYGRSGVDSDQLVLVYAGVASLMLLIGYAPEILLFIKKRIPKKHSNAHSVFIPLMTSLSADGKIEFFLAIMTFGLLLLLVGHAPDIRRYFREHFFHKQKHIH